MWGDCNPSGRRDLHTLESGAALWFSVQLLFYDPALATAVVRGIVFFGLPFL